MKVKELIELLKNHDQEKDIVVIDEHEEIGLEFFAGSEEDESCVYLSFEKFKGESKEQEQTYDFSQYETTVNFERP